MAIELTSSAFEHGQRIPERYTGEGADVSPPLSWTGIPDEAKELALICDDPDAPTAEPWVHWVIYKIPVEASGLPEKIEKRARLKRPPGMLQGENSWPAGQNNIGYRGPMPPPGGEHRYIFRLYALEAKLVVEPGLSKRRLLEEFRNHVLEEGHLIGVYQR